MKNCQYCKSQIVENAKFCQDCGTRCEENKPSIASATPNITTSNLQRRKSRLGLGIIVIMIIALIAYILWGIKFSD
ncbi:MAG: hypothetical protein IK065_00795 [Neisseriaceae bacterium]|nr:hypothetical protein [Neisseriaceae bacterium]